ncbi:hypothetical protein [Romboutsia sp. 1001713B170207_170306_H8]|uniref:hypothetical protein n=1 Tax=Romboutsia sp. 1001713B170207_170306_H8 TaxID=2787112 RepID=UPI000822EC15|nr:hypothetical protein [Romboutsia sp. 1001713B170207_170306_H8]SCI08239.1 Uncharacterised protein [uncultured Clostridium sp.]SCI10109.1 Uncharacterised protein [uncultured Clostridium sp.]
MKIVVKKEMESIKCGDLVYSSLLREYGFVCHIENKYYFINREFENWSDPYEELKELIHKTNLELVAKNKKLKVSLINEVI